MKLSLFLTALILLAAGAWHFTRHRPLEKLRQEAVTLRQSVIATGLDPQAAATGKAVRASTKNDAAAAALAQENRRTDARNFAQELITFALEMKEREKQKQQPDEAMQKRIMAIMDRFLDLDADGLRIVIGQLKDTPALEAKTKSEVLGMSVMILAQSDPAAAIQLFTEAKDVLAANAGMANHMSGMCLASWGEKDPAALLTWMNRKENSGFLTTENRRMAFTGLAKKDPALALKTLLASPESTTGNDEHLTTASMIANGIPAASRQALLDAALALKAEPSGQADALKRTETIKRNILSGLGTNLGQDNPADSIAWIEKANLPAADRSHLLQSVASSLYGKNPTPWLEWIGTSVKEPEQIKQLSDSIIPSWTRRDFNGAGEWIKTQPEGPLRTNATQSFAKTLAPHEPEAAAAWALTLPPADDRTRLLQDIVKQWSTKDPTAAATFATQNNLAPPP